MHYYLAHQIEHINKKHTYQYDDEDNIVSESLETDLSIMVQDNKILKIISSETPIELGEEIIENHMETVIYDSYWEERWIIIQELHPNFWRM